MRIADLESEIVQLVANDPALERHRSPTRVSPLRVAGREYTVVGHYSYFERVDAARLFLPGFSMDWSEASGMLQPGNVGVGMKVYIEEGLIDCIELFVLAVDVFPEEFDSAEFAYGLNAIWDRLHGGQPERE